MCRDLPRFCLQGFGDSSLTYRSTCILSLALRNRLDTVPGIDSTLSGSRRLGLSTIILPPFGNPKRLNFGPKAAAMVAIETQSKTQ